MKHTILSVFFLFCILFSQAQLQITEPDKSPMDMSYFPHGYPILKFQVKGTPDKPKARVIYSRPQKNNRNIFGEVVKYGEVWRMGANESTELDFYRDVVIGGKKVLKGRYTLYCIPFAEKWTIVLNKDLDSWGAFSYKKELDVARVDVPVSRIDIPAEYFTLVFDNAGNLLVVWDNVKTLLPIKYL